MANKKEYVKAEPKAPETKCYKFNDTWSIGGIVYAKDSCIHLTQEQYDSYSQYVYECTGEKSIDGKCKRC